MKKALILGLMLPAMAVAKSDIVTLGTYQVFCGGEWVNQHISFIEAFATATNAKADCYLEQPRISVTYTPDAAPPDVTDPDEPVGQSVTLSWEIPTEREDGSALPLEEIEGYVIRGGPSLEALAILHTTGPSDVSWVYENAPTGTLYFTISTKDSDGIEGPQSTPIDLVVL